MQRDTSNATPPPTLSFGALAFLLGLTSAIGPFAIDMYLPALPTIGADLGASVAQVQASLMAYFLAMGLGQVVYGPFSDRYGRRLSLFVGLAVFSVASVGCALSQTPQTLIAWRFLQGIGACAGGVVPRAIVRDLHTGPQAARLMARLMLVFSVSPILAPLVGSQLMAVWSWHAVFWAVTLIAVFTGILVAWKLPETHPPQRRAAQAISPWQAYARLLRDRHYLGLVATGGFCISGFFMYLAASSFVLMDGYGLSPTAYSVAFAANAMSFIGVSQVAGRLAQRWGMARVARTASLGHALCFALLAAAQWMGFTSLPLMLGILLVGFGFSGLIVPMASVLALESHGTMAGAAAALMGTGHFLIGATMMAVLSAFSSASALPMISGIALSSALTAWIAHRTLTPHSPRTAGAL